MPEKLCNMQSRNSFASEESLYMFLISIAKRQAQEVQVQGKTCVKAKSWNLSLNTKKLNAFLPNVFANLDAASVDDALKTLQNAVGTLIADSVMVRNQGNGELVPIVYEALTLIFSKTNENFRLQNFHKLIDFYYNELENLLQDKLVAIYPNRLKFDLEVKILLPIVKIDVLQNLIKEEEDAGRSNQLSDIGNNLRNFIDFPRLNQEDIYVIVKNKLKSGDFELQNYQLTPLTESNGHLGEYFKLKIDIKQYNKNITLNLFAKFLTPQAESLKEVLKLGPSMKENWFYFGYLPKLRDIGLSDLLTFAPNCYFSRIDDVIILDDLSIVGYTGLTPNIKLDYNTLRPSVRILAKLHACSLIAEEKLSQSEGKNIRFGDIYGDYLKEVVFTPEAPFIREMDGMIENCILHFLHTFSYTEEEQDEKLKEKVKAYYDLVFEKVKKSDKYRNVICHGDIYVSNMLFKFDDRRECEDIKLIDFQILRYCPPSQDLLFFLFQNSLKETLDRHFEDLINEYYSALSDYLQQHHIDINKIYDRDTFDECILDMKPGALMQAFFYSPFHSLNPKLREEITTSNEEIEKMKKDHLYLLKKGMEDKHYANIMKGLTKQFAELLF